MAGQGCPNEGDDTRFMGWLICPIQRFLKVKSHQEPFSVMIGVWPPYIAVNVPMFWTKGKPATATEWGFKRTLHWHFGVRYDVNSRIYIWPAWSLKTTDRAFFY